MVDGPDTQAYLNSVNDPGDTGVNFFATDEREAQKLSQFYPSASGQPWWASLASYGATRAIDAHFGPAAPNKTATPGTFAGQNGKTYSNGNTLAGGGGNDSLLLIGLAVAALFALG